MRLRGTLSILTWAAAAVSALQTPSLDHLARDVERVESVREIKDLTRTFSQLVQFGRWKDVASLFTDDGLVRVGTMARDNITVWGRDAIEKWIEQEHGAMDGIRPGSLSTWLVDQPVTTLAVDGQTAQARWLVLRLLGDGKGRSRIHGGIFENRYEKREAGWKFSLLHYLPMFDGDYATGWTNTGEGERLMPIIPYHFTPDSAGIPVLAAGPTFDKAPPTNATVEELAARIARLNDEDAVRNLQHAYGFYVDRRMWTDVVDLFAPNSSITTDGVRFNGTIREHLEREMGPEDLSYGIINDHPMLDTIVYIHPNGQEATTRGFELGMIGDVNTTSQHWEFNIFRNTFTKDPTTGIWKLQHLSQTRLLHANYTPGWATGGILPSRPPPSPPPFLDITNRARVPTPTTKTTANLTAALARSAAVDGIENISSAYGFFADDIRCTSFATLHHPLGHKESPFVGWYRTPERIAQACLSRYATFDPAPQRPRVPFHWRLQPVVLVSDDGRSGAGRTRLLQWGTGNATRGGFSGVAGFNAGVYHDQFVWEEGTGRWRLWSLTIDEFYWQSRGWGVGWAVEAPAATTTTAVPAATETVPVPAATETPGLAVAYPPDVLLTDPGLGRREEGFVPPLVDFPGIKPMWFAYRNLVSGRVPENYWPGCVPCSARREWSLEAAGFQEPPTGPRV
ncbi:hypothetical protein QBC39DRAFT_304547 [Podospora conica]|nr:hypothetical protein QBC39DRAFT_304547 [Schizothecium conicum]